MEAAEAYTQMAGVDEGLMLSSGDLVYKALDLPYAQEIAERRQLLLPPPIQQKLTEGKDLPPEVQAAMAQVQQAQAQVQEHGKLVQAAEQELKELQAQAKGDAASAKLAQANLQSSEIKLEGRFNELQAAEEKLDNERALFDKHVENALLKIKLAKTEAANALEREAHHSDLEHERAANELGHKERDVGEAVREGSHQLETQKRDVQDTVKDGSHQLEKQATQMSVQNMQAQHKQQMSQAKANKPKPAKK
jgi:chromosome segregation ATPase